MRQVFFLIFMVFSLGGYSQQISSYGYVDVSELIRINTETAQGRTILQRWDRMFNIDRISPHYKASFLEFNTDIMPVELLIERAKRLAFSNGYSPSPLSRVYIKIEVFDAKNRTSHLRQIDSLARVWHNRLPFEKQTINVRIRNLFAEEHVSSQKFYNSFIRGNKREKFLPIVNKLRNEFNAICREQGVVPNSFDNNYFDQNYCLRFFLNLCSFYDDAEQLSFWNENLNYFIATFKAGKITNDFCYYYDLHLRTISGMQYFGTLRNTPIKDFETFEQRRKELDIDDLIQKLKEKRWY